MTLELKTLLADPPDEAGPRVSRVRLEGQEVFICSVPLYQTRYPAGATGSEREIIDLLLGGDALKAIAQRRGASVRTVTTQLAEIYRKAGVGSSRQLAAFTTGVDGPWPV